MIGQRLGEYQIIRFIGKGAAARVWLASNGRDILAVKVFPEAHRGRADREYMLGSGLNHPNLNQILDRQEVAGQAALLMPFVKGRPLGQPDSRRELFRQVAGVAAGLGFLHARGIVHRDVKPENIILTPEGIPVLLDFDLATRAGEQPERDRVVGTISFISPEQAQSGVATTASDIYSLGVLLYRGLGGEMPFSGDSLEVMHAHIHRKPPAPGAGPEADALVLRMLAKDPADRPDAADVEASLARLSNVNDSQLE